MNSKEKAKELIYEFQNILPDHLGAMEEPIAKMCARHTVNKIIESNPTFIPYGLEPTNSSVKYWKEVLLELKK